jgi:hypothetical protein
METICPKCGEDTCIKIDLADGDTCTCTGCDEEFSVGTMRALVASWGPLLAWLDGHPAKKGA